jgi:hypothetical protein
MNEKLKFFNHRWTRMDTDKNRGWKIENGGWTKQSRNIRQVQNPMGRVERRRRMFRPMTSKVSALSGSVATGHQTVHPGSSAPSKIPYGGFSPVRLQTRLKLQRSLNAAARHLAGPALDGTFTTELELACTGALRAQVGHDYRNIRFIPDRTLTGCSVSLVGCTPNRTKPGLNRTKLDENDP